ncbi:hypothetical protein GH721_09615 [Kriegella sp. EG-1]|nr:hypothetical protein [Flavobacteriaceae bacterium EG-1]
MIVHFNKPGRIKVFLKDSNKKNFFKICKEVLVLWATKKEVPMYYFKHLYRKDITNYREYMGSKLVRRIKASTRLHKPEYTSILNNKLNFSLYCEKNSIPTPTLLGHNFETTFFYQNKVSHLRTLDDLIQFYRLIFDTKNLQAIFFRPLALLGGKGCFKLDKKNYSEKLKAEFKNLLQGDYTHTEVIAQHPDINRIYAKSINTLRILTYLNKDGVEVVTSFIRFGAGGSVVDNGSSGGLSVGIVQESGTLKCLSYVDMEFGGGELERHPDTAFLFEGFKIPFFKEACELVKQATEHIPNGFIGWDVAITPTGPTIIEGNENPSLFVMDVLDGGLLKNPKMKNVIAAI